MSKRITRKRKMSDEEMLLAQVMAGTEAIKTYGEMADRSVYNDPILVSMAMALYAAVRERPQDLQLTIGLTLGAAYTYGHTRDADRRG